MKLIWKVLGTTGLVGSMLSSCSKAEDEFDIGVKKFAADYANISKDAYVCDFKSDSLGFVAQGSKWQNKNISISFMPDGTVFSGYSSDLIARMDLVAPRAVWQREFARAFARWSEFTNLNFRFTSDNGSAGSIAGLMQGDTRFGDIRIGQRLLGTGIGAVAYYPNAGATTGGDLSFNSSTTYAIAANPDIYTFALHEIGHSIGLDHSVYGSVMYGAIFAVNTAGLKADDIAGVQSIYGVRLADSYDLAQANNAAATASAINVTAGNVTRVFGDITTAADEDYYQVQVPANSPAVLSVTALANQALLKARIRILDGAQNILVDNQASIYGGQILAEVDVVSGDTYYVQVTAGDDTAFAVGAYTLAMQYKSAADGIAYAPIANLNSDSRELNDALANANALGQFSSRTVSGLSIHWANDEDFFSFRTASSNANFYQVSVAPTTGSSPLVISVYSAAGALIASSNGSSNSLTFATTRSTTYYAKIHSLWREPRAYGMTIKSVASLTKR